MKKRRKIILAGLMCMMMALSGCKQMDSVIEEDERDVTEPVDQKNVTSGVYILTEDGTFYKANTLYQSFTQEATVASSDRYVYSVKDAKFIPTLYKNDALIYVSSSSIPKEISVERFKSCGYTIGAVAISKGTSGAYSVTNNNIISGSDFETQVTKNIGEAKTIVLKKANDTTVSDKNLTKAGTLETFKKDQEIVLDCYVGTYYKEIETKADTKIWVSASVSTIDDIELTKHGYVILNHSLDEGYYNINNEGLICYKNEKRPAE